MSGVGTARVLVLSGYFALLGLLLGWYAWRAIATGSPVALLLGLLIVLWLAPLRGLLHGRRYTHAWAGMLVLLYFVHGTVEAVSNPVERLAGAVEAVLSLVVFLGAILYLRRSRGVARAGR